MSQDVTENLPVCGSRYVVEGLPAPSFFCAHPEMTSPRAMVTAEQCQACTLCHAPPPRFRRMFPPARSPLPRLRCLYMGEQIGTRPCEECPGSTRLKIFECTHPDHEEANYSDCARCPDHEFPLIQGTHMNYAVGVLVRAGDEARLPRALEYLRLTGFVGVRLFTDGAIELPARSAQFQVTAREGVVGEWPHWFLALSELVLRQPEAQAYLMVRAPVILPLNLRRYLDQVLWPASKVGVVSLHDPAQARLGPPQLRRVQQGWNWPSAEALVFPAASARALLAHPGAVNHRLRGVGEGLAHVANVVGRWSQEADMPLYVHAPSLVDCNGGDLNREVVGSVTGGSVTGASAAGEFRPSRDDAAVLLHAFHGARATGESNAQGAPPADQETVGTGK